MESLLSRRGKECLDMDNPAFTNLEEYRKNPWSPDNTSGHVNLSTADNHLSRDLIADKLSLIGFSNVLRNPDIYGYPKAGGMPKTVESLSKFITRYFDTDKPIQPENLCIVPGVTAGIEMVAASVCDPYEAFLCPSPYYVRIDNDFQERAQVNVIPVSMIDKKNDGKFNLTVQAIADVFEESTSKGITVRGIFLINPHNPTATVTKPKQLMKILNYAMEKKMIVMMNEIYALSTFDQNSGFKSILSYFSKLPDPGRIVWMWGTSKDFCIPGIRFATIYSENREILDCVRRFCQLQPVAAPIETTVRLLVSDFEWLDMYFKENQSRLRSAFQYTSKRLNQIGVPHITAQGGFFIYLDFRNFLKSQTFEEERQLEVEFRKSGIFWLTGESHKCTQPGWFRMVFTADRDALDEGLNRIEKILCKISRFLITFHTPTKCKGLGRNQDFFKVVSII